MTPEHIQQIFPGSEPYLPTEPSPRLCLLKDVIVNVVWENVAYLHHVDMEGIETDVDNPLDSAPALGMNHRVYICQNCGFQCDGSEMFDTMRDHLGKRNTFLHPFTGTL